MIVKEYKIQFPLIVQKSADSTSFVNVSLFSFISLGCKASELHQLVSTHGRGNADVAPFRLGRWSVIIARFSLSFLFPPLRAL